jgi:hypothetical protein
MNQFEILAVPQEAKKAPVTSKEEVSTLLLHVFAFSKENKVSEIPGYALPYEVKKVVDNMPVDDLTGMVAERLKHFQEDIKPALTDEVPSPDFWYMVQKLQEFVAEDEM